MHALRRAASRPSLDQPPTSAVQRRNQAPTHDTEQPQRSGFSDSMRPPGKEE